MLIRSFALATVFLLMGTVSHAQNLKEQAQNHHQIQTGKAALDRDRAELQQMVTNLTQLKAALQNGNQAIAQSLQQRIHGDMTREVQQGEAKVAAYQREVQQSKAEVRTENREIRHNHRDSRRGLDRRDDRRDMAGDRADRRDDVRDVRDDQNDRAAAIARVQRQRTILNTLPTPAAVGQRRDLIEEFVGLMKADIADTQRELGEDHREVREDRRERRDDRRERREWR